jgi:ABC-type branched-subunit amino acid transport system permease subunit
MTNSFAKFKWVILFGLVPIVATLPLPDFWIYQLNYIGLYALTCLGLVLLTGVAGLTSFGQPRSLVLVPTPLRGSL